MRNLRKTRLSALAFLPLFAALSACGTNSKITPVQIQYPAALFQCRDIPSSESVSTDDQVADYIVELGMTAKDCKERLRAVGDMLKPKEEVKK